MVSLDRDIPSSQDVRITLGSTEYVSQHRLHKFPGFHVTLRPLGTLATAQVDPYYTFLLLLSIENTHQVSVILLL